MFGAKLGPGIGGAGAKTTATQQSGLEPAWQPTYGYGLMTGQKANAPAPSFGAPGMSGQTGAPPQQQRSGGQQAGQGSFVEDAAKVAKTGKKAYDTGSSLFGSDDIVYGSGLSFSPEQIAEFQAGGLTPQAASGPEGLSGGLSTGTGSALAGVGSAAKHYMQTGEAGESIAKGGLTGAGTLAATTMLGPVGLVAGPLIDFGLSSLMADTDEPHVSVDIGPDPAYRRTFEEDVPTGYRENERHGGRTPTGYETQEVTHGVSGYGLDSRQNVLYPEYETLSDPNNKANPDQVRAWGEALGVPVETLTWETHEEAGEYGGTRTTQHESAYFTEELPELSNEEYMQHRMDLIGQGKLPGEIVESPSGSKVIVDQSPRIDGVGDTVYQSTKYPYLNVWTDDIDDTQAGTAVLASLEQQADQLAAQGQNPEEVFGSQYFHRYKPEDDLMDDIYATTSEHYGVKLGPGIGGTGSTTSSNQQTGLSVGNVSTVGKVLG